MLNKAIIYGKEKRKPYRGSKSFDYSCKNHGSCDYCKDNRLFFDKKKRIASELDIKEYKMSWNGGYLPSGKWVTDIDIFLNEWYEFRKPIEEYFGYTTIGFNDSSGEGDVTYSLGWKLLTLPCSFISKINKLIENVSS